MTTTKPGRERRSRIFWIAGGTALVIVAIIAAVWFSSAQSRAASRAPATVAVTRGNIIATIDGSGTVKAAQSLDLNFATSGTVAEVLISEGDSVKKGQPLAKIDTRDLQSQVDSAQANLNSAHATLDQAKQGNATPQDIAAQQASVRNAQANLEKTRTGSSTAADIAEAQASLTSAQSKLDALEHPSQDKVSAQQLKVNQAQSSLESTRTNASATKTNADIALSQSTDALTKAQTAFATAKKNWDYVDQTNQDPTNPSTTNAQGKKVANKLTDTQRQQYYDTFAQAQASLSSAELDVQKSQVAFDKARQDEISQIQDAEATLANEQKQLDALLTPDTNDIVQAQASVDQAKASLNKLRQGGTKADVAASQATVDQAKANLDKLTAPSTESDVQIKQAAVDQAAQSLRQAQINLEKATLAAPFDGIVSSVAIVPGSTAASSGTAALTLVNRNPLHVDMSLSENDVAKIQAGQVVSMTIDALTGWAVEGTVGYIAPSSTETNGVVTYKVRVDFPDSDARVKIGMTANVSIVIARKENVLLVPNSSLVPNGANKAVQVAGTQSGANEQAQEITVQTGLTDGSSTEIVSGLTEGQQIIVAPSSGTSSSGSGPFGG